MEDAWAKDYSRNRAGLHEMVWRRDMPTLQGNETSYRVPASASARLVYRRLPFDQTEDFIVSSSAWKQVLPKEEMAGGRQMIPLRARAPCSLLKRPIKRDALSSPQ
jgi:hypothetical protein